MYVLILGERERTIAWHDFVNRKRGLAHRFGWVVGLDDEALCLLSDINLSGGSWLEASNTARIRMRQAVYNQAVTSLVVWCVCIRAAMIYVVPYVIPVRVAFDRTPSVGRASSEGSSSNFVKREWLKSTASIPVQSMLLLRVGCVSCIQDMRGMTVPRWCSAYGNLGRAYHRCGFLI